MKSKKIILKSHYPGEYRRALWLRFCEIFERADMGRRPFFQRKMLPVLNSSSHRISHEKNASFLLDADSIVDADCRLISEFCRRGKERNFNTAVWQLFDAFVQLESPKFAELHQARDDLFKMGEIVGHFLRDPQMGNLSYLLAQAGQSLLHFFSYDNLDTLGSHDETQRFLCLFVGNTPEYLFAIDFAFLEEEIVFLKDEKLRLYYGFCAPGEDFSPIVMRSYCLRERLAGILYSQSAFINLDSEKLKNLTFEAYTTDKSFHGQSLKRKANLSPAEIAVQMALKAHKGLRLPRNLEKIEESTRLYKLLNNRVRQFKVDFLH